MGRVLGQELNTAATYLGCFGFILVQWEEEEMPQPSLFVPVQPQKHIEKVMINQLKERL